MNKTVTYIAAGKASQIDTPTGILTEVKPAFLSQALHIFRSNQSRNISNSKTRSEVSGTTRKPWKQKGTGRARHGSMRSPIWVGGGITFGPTNLKNNSKKTTAKQRLLALQMLLTLAIDNKKMIVVDSIPEFKKTKEASVWLNKLPVESGLITLLTDNNNIKPAFANLANVSFESVTHPSLGRMSQSSWLVLTKSDLENLSKRSDVTEGKAVAAKPQAKSTKKVEK